MILFLNFHISFYYSLLIPDIFIEPYHTLFEQKKMFLRTRDNHKLVHESMDRQKKNPQVSKESYIESISNRHEIHIKEIQEQLEICVPELFDTDTVSVVCKDSMVSRPARQVLCTNRGDGVFSLSSPTVHYSRNKAGKTFDNREDKNVSDISPETHGIAQVFSHSMLASIFLGSDYSKHLAVDKLHEPVSTCIDVVAKISKRIKQTTESSWFNKIPTNGYTFFLSKNGLYGVHDEVSGFFTIPRSIIPKNSRTGLVNIADGIKVTPQSGWNVSISDARLYETNYGCLFGTSIYYYPPKSPWSSIDEVSEYLEGISFVTSLLPGGIEEDIKDEQGFLDTIDRADHEKFCSYIGISIDDGIYTRQPIKRDLKERSSPNIYAPNIPLSIAVTSNGGRVSYHIIFFIVLSNGDKVPILTPKTNMSPSFIFGIENRFQWLIDMTQFGNRAFPTDSHANLWNLLMEAKIQRACLGLCYIFLAEYLIDRKLRGGPVKSATEEDWICMAALTKIKESQGYTSKPRKVLAYFPSPSALFKSTWKWVPEISTEYDLVTNKRLQDSKENIEKALRKLFDITPLMDIRRISDVLPYPEITKRMIINIREFETGLISETEIILGFIQIIFLFAENKIGSSDIIIHVQQHKSKVYWIMYIITMSLS